ncbi:fragmin60 [Pluteus cervinus]|uniref:Fragmin60 n=1 Tax=Pluteus cervinus TaxID=181527 RepID=A0ACD3AZA2_9AGAR|nr:fragmin60 [Pluteus cervinus]
MAHLTKPTRYDIKDSNIALLGSDLEKRVREHAGDVESAWNEAGLQVGLQIWRVEKFKIVSWPKERYGSFYDGDSYIVLKTYKKDKESDVLSYDLHFWLGEDTSQDEAGTAAYKTVELDDHLKGVPIQYREVQGYESAHFLSYFPRFIALSGGVATGFHHVSSLPPPSARRLYRVLSPATTSTTKHSSLVIREVRDEAASLVVGDVYVLDRGKELWQLNTKKSLGKERFRAAEFVRELANGRKEGAEVHVFDEGGPGAGKFLAAFGDGTILHPEDAETSQHQPVLHRLSDSTGSVEFTQVEGVAYKSFGSSDAFLLDDSTNPVNPAVYIWIGKEASLTERRLAGQYAQHYLYRKLEGGRKVAVSIVKMAEGRESEEFLRLTKN